MKSIIKEIYFIDDSEDEIFLTSMLFKVQNIAIKLNHFNSYKEFEHLINKDNISFNKNGILAVDLNMPDTNGIEIIEKVRKNSILKNVIAGICTGSEDPADKQAAYNVGADFFIQKPLDDKALTEVCKLVDCLQAGFDEHEKFNLYRV